MPWKLELLRGSDIGQEYELVEHEEVVLGRDAACNIVVDDQLASRRHARLIPTGDSYLLEDLGSTNHTYLNGEPVGEKVHLVDRDLILVGNTRLAFRKRASKVLAKETSDTVNVLSSIDARLRTDTAIVNADARLRAILKITETLGTTLDLEPVLSKMLDGLLVIFRQADCALVLLVEGERLVPKAAKRRHGDAGSIEYSSTIVRRAMENGEAIISTDIAADDRLPITRSIAEYKIRSIMCVPLISQQAGVLGVIQLDARSTAVQFDADDAQIFAGVARQAAMSVEYAQLHKEKIKQARLQREMDFAQEMQQHFLPTVPQESQGYRFWAYYSAAGKVGGDYYDFIRLPNGCQAVLLGDVSGKGVPAALMMAKLSAVGKVAMLSHPDSVSHAVAAINNEICEASLHYAFVTLVMCIIDPQSHKVTFGNAGHLAPIVRRVDGAVEELAADVRGYPLGIFPDTDYKTASTVLAPGELVVLCSDGITEAMNARDDMYTSERVCEQLADMQNDTPEDMGQALLRDVRRHADGCEQSDDISLLVFQRA